MGLDGEGNTKLSYLTGTHYNATSQAKGISLIGALATSTEHRVKITRTPIMISTIKNEVKWFYTYEEANDFKTESKSWYHRYIKGLGSLNEQEYDTIINKPVYDTVTVDDAKYFEMMFGKDAGLRKEFMFEE
jgi:DNA gyrase/topoisomerase IV subunit B